TAENAEFPAVAVRIVEPKAHVFRAGRFRPDFVAWIFDVGTDTFQMRKRFSQGRHVRQMKRHVINRFRRRFAFEQGNGDVVVADCNAVIEIELFSQPQRALEPFCALLRIAYRQSKVTDLPEHERNFRHLSIYSRLQTIATEVVRLPPMLNVRNLFAFSIWRLPACSVSCWYASKTWRTPVAPTG